MTTEEAKLKISDIISSIDVCSKDEYDDVIKPISDIIDKDKIEAFAMEKLYPAGGCLVPDNIDVLPKLELPNHKFIAPKTADMFDYCTPPTNQGNKPHCAGHAAASWAENLIWRIKDYWDEIDPDMIYAEAKRIDGNPNSSGTTLTAVMQVLLNKGYFDKNKCKIQVIYNDPMFIDKIKYAIHKFGNCLIALNITEEWYKVNNYKNTIYANKDYRFCGGHALHCVGIVPEGIIVQNSWGRNWGDEGFAYVTWKALKEQFLYAAVMTNTLDGLKLN